MSRNNIYFYETHMWCREQHIVLWTWRKMIPTSTPHFKRFRRRIATRLSRQTLQAVKKGNEHWWYNEPMVVNKKSTFQSRWNCLTVKEYARESLPKRLHVVYAVQAHVPRVIIASPSETKLHKKAPSPTWSQSCASRSDLLESWGSSSASCTCALLPLRPDLDLRNNHCYRSSRQSTWEPSVSLNTNGAKTSGSLTAKKPWSFT